MNPPGLFGQAPQQRRLVHKHPFFGAQRADHDDVAPPADEHIPALSAVPFLRVLLDGVNHLGFGHGASVMMMRPSSTWEM